MTSFNQEMENRALKVERDDAVHLVNKFAREAQDATAENHRLANAVATLSGKLDETGRKLTARRDISKQRLDVLTKQTRTIFAQDKKIDEIKEKSDKRAEVIRDYHRKFCGQNVRIDVLDQSNVTLREVVEALQRTIGDREERNVSLREAHDRAVKQRNIGRNQLAADGAEINELRARIKQGDEEMRLLMADIHPDGRIRGATAAEQSMTQEQRDAVEHVAGEANRFTQSKIAGLQHKNQEIGSQLGYYKQETSKLRIKQKIQVATIKRLRMERDVIAEISGAWKRKYHGLLKYHSPRFTPRANGSATERRSVGFQPGSIGRNADD